MRRGKVIYGPDLSLESQAPNLRNLDTNGHGTFMAGLIAGNDSGLAANYGRRRLPRHGAGRAHRGLKVGVADGGVDVTQVIAAIDWVVQHRIDNGLNIRVLNLSYGTNSTQSYRVDPLAFAAEQAWKARHRRRRRGRQQRLPEGQRRAPASPPGLRPVRHRRRRVRLDGHGRPDATTRCPPSRPAARRGGCRNPDFVAPGAHLQGLRVPNSFIDAHAAERRARRPLLPRQRHVGVGGDRRRAPSRSSSDSYPTATPDQVKRFAHDDSARQLQRHDARRRARARSTSRAIARQRRVPAPARTSRRSTGTGSLERARGRDHLTRDGVVLNGEIDIFGQPFDSAALAALEAAGSAWTGGTWNGNTWSGNSWSGNSWSGSSWSGNSWSGNSWSGSSWSGSSWSGNSWSGSSWSGNSWSGTSWSGSSWSTAGWMEIGNPEGSSAQGDIGLLGRRARIRSTPAALQPARRSRSS